MTLIQELAIGEQILGDIAIFASGQPVTATKKIAGTDYTLSVVALTAQPTSTSGYVVLAGTMMQLFELALLEATNLAAGGSLMVAERIGNTWYGTTISSAAAASAVPKVA